jgi:hypothetical protein
MKKQILKVTSIFLTLGLLVSLDVPKGWHIAGSKPKSYEMGVEKTTEEGKKNSATIKSIENEINGFGTLMQSSLPKELLGKRVKMSGEMKSSDVKYWAGFWLRVDQEKSRKPLAFDNMSERPVKGTSDWTKYEIVLDIPKEASNIAYGALLNGTGQIWFDNIKFEVVGKDEKTTGKKGKQLTNPTNLNFDNE